MRILLKGNVMGRQFNFSRLETIIKRQDPARFGSEYAPAMRATREEAPSKSRASILNVKKLGREFHVMSSPEKFLALLALYHPNLIDLHEQFVLWPWEYPHPLVGMPGIDSMGLSPIKGTMDVCERLGYQDFQPTLLIKTGNKNKNEKVKVPRPFLGDFLLFMKKDKNIYCVNWPVKDKEENFTRPPPGKRVASSEKSKLRALARVEIEVQYFSDPGIRTQHVASENIDRQVAENLRQLFPYTYKKTSLTNEEEKRIINGYKAALELEIPPMEVMANLVFRGVCDAYEARVIFYQSIWERKLRVDLFKPVLVNHPLKPEEQDVLDVYGGWFEP